MTHQVGFVPAKKHAWFSTNGILSLSLKHTRTLFQEEGNDLCWDDRPLFLFFHNERTVHPPTKPKKRPHIFQQTELHPLSRNQEDPKRCFVFI